MLSIRRDHPRGLIEMKFCTAAGLQGIVLSFEFHQNRLSVFGTVGVEICSFPVWERANFDRHSSETALASEYVPDFS